MKHLLKFYIIILLAMGNLYATNNTDTHSTICADQQVTVVENMRGLYDIQNPNDGDMIYVQGFRNKYDGGGGFFIFDAASTVVPVYLNGNDFKAGNGYDDTISPDNPNSPLAGKWDGMVCKPKPTQPSQTLDPVGRWFRQWDSGKLNIRWVGGNPSYNVSIALNAALHYAELNLDTGNPFGNQNYVNAGKTIFFPAGRYRFVSPIMAITKGVLIEGEGNMGLSDHSTHFTIYAGAEDEMSSSFFRFTTLDGNNSGGGFKDLHISVKSFNDAPPNLILLETSGENNITHWKTQNVSFALEGNASRSIYMKGDTQRRSIQNIMLMNSWFGGNAESKQSVLAENVERLQIIGGFFSSGRGFAPSGQATPISDPGITLGGTLGCAYVQLNDIDLTHGFIEIGDKSAHTYISCRFARLNIFNPASASHINLNVSEQHYINERELNIPTSGVFRLRCPEPAESDYKCYNFTREIELDTFPNSGWN